MKKTAPNPTSIKNPHSRIQSSTFSIVMHVEGGDGGDGGREGGSTDGVSVETELTGVVSVTGTVS